jgi:hypothetical protein
MPVAKRVHSLIYTAPLHWPVRRRPRLGMGWLRSVLSPLRRLWCRANAVQRKSTLPFVDVWLCFSFFLRSALNGEFFFFVVFHVCV